MATSETGFVRAGGTGRPISIFDFDSGRQGRRHDRSIPRSIGPASRPQALLRRTGRTRSIDGWLPPTGRAPWSNGMACPGRVLPFRARRRPPHQLGPRTPCRRGRYARPDGRIAIVSVEPSLAASRPSGGGNHRGSIFRLLVGSALKARAGADEPTSRGIGADSDTAARKLGVDRAAVVGNEATLETEVSRHIDAMPFLWLRTDDPPGPKVFAAISSETP